MTPVFENGDFAIGQCLPGEANLYPGDIVQVDHPDLGLIVKYIATVSPSGVRLIGAASSSIDSHATGVIARERVISRLVWRIKPARIDRLRPEFSFSEAES